jgi:hypothetical protein
MGPLTFRPAGGPRPSSVDPRPGGAAGQWPGPPGPRREALRSSSGPGAVGARAWRRGDGRRGVASRGAHRSSCRCAPRGHTSPAGAARRAPTRRTQSCRRRSGRGGFGGCGACVRAVLRARGARGAPSGGATAQRGGEAAGARPALARRAAAGRERGSLASAAPPARSLRGRRAPPGPRRRMRAADGPRGEARRAPAPAQALPLRPWRPADSPAGAGRP